MAMRGSRPDIVECPSLPVAEIGLLDVQHAWSALTSRFKTIISPQKSNTY